MAAAPERTIASFYRTAAGAEVDLFLELPGKRGTWAIEIKRSLVAKVKKGFHIACDDLKPSRRCVVYGGDEDFFLSPGMEAIGLRSMVSMLQQ